MNRLNVLALALALCAAVAFHVSCGGGNSPVASTSPVATPPPTPTPTPSPTPTPGSQFVCGAGVVSGDASCPEGQAQFAADVEIAIDQSIAETGAVVGGRITSMGRYVLGVLKSLEAKGYCVDYDGEEVQIKRDNSFHEQYDIVISGGFVRRGEGAYRTTCTPAAFPTPAPPLEPTPGCALPPSREKACGRDDDGGAFVTDMDEVIQEVSQKRPDIFSGGRVRDVDAYYNGIVDGLRERGLCASTDYEEVHIKRTNEYSENYDPLLASREIRNGRGAYRVRCYPASF